MEKTSITIAIELKDGPGATTLHGIAELDDWLADKDPKEIDNIAYTVVGGDGPVAHYELEAPDVAEMWVRDGGGLMILARGERARHSLGVALKLYERCNRSVGIIANAMGHTRAYTFSSLYLLDVWLQDLGSGYVLTDIVYRESVVLKSEFQHSITDNDLKAMVIVQDGSLRIYAYAPNVRASLRAALAWCDARTAPGMEPEDEIDDSCE